MSKKDSFTTSDYIDFDRALNTGRKLVKERNIIGLYIIVSIYTGLRVSDVLNLEWSSLLSDNMFIIEKKTKKSKTVPVHNEIKNALRYFSIEEGKVFKSQKGSVYSIQSINRVLKGVFSRELNDGNNISSHSLRKSFGRRVYNNNGRTEDALVKLSKLLNHSSLAVTRTYLGITQQELNDIYMNL